MSESPLAAFPVNSAIFVFEQGSPELTRVSRVDDIVGVLVDTIENLRKVTKYGVDASPDFDFTSLLASGISCETIQSVTHEIRSGLFRALADRNIDIDSL